MELRVVLILCVIWLLLGPEVFKSDLLGQLLHGIAKVGLREWRFNTVLEAIPQQVFHTWRGLGVGAEAVVGGLCKSVEVEYLCFGHLSEDCLDSRPDREVGVEPISILGYCFLFVLSPLALNKRMQCGFVQ